MNNITENTFGTPFERIFVTFISIATGITLIYLAIEGPLFLHHIKYKTAEVINNQLVGQDIVNMFILSPILIIGGIALFFRKRISKYLLIMTPLYLIYFVFSYTIGWEWSSTKYAGNSESYTFYFFFILIFSLFLIIFASMWIKEVQEVVSTGTTRAYDIAPTAFWLVRIFDLGFTVPFGLISVYLLWVKPNTTYPIQFMFYGFFLTMIIAVNSMGLVMFLSNDPTFLIRDLIVFSMLALIIFIGFIYVLRNYKSKI